MYKTKTEIYIANIKCRYELVYNKIMCPEGQFVWRYLILY